MLCLLRSKNSRTDFPTAKRVRCRPSEISMICPPSLTRVCLAMRTCIECDLLVARQTLVSEGGQIIEISEGRHRTRFAVGKSVLEFLLRSKHSMRCTRCCSQAGKINLRRGGNNGHSQRTIQLHDHCLGQLFAWRVSKRGDPLRRVRN